MPTATVKTDFACPGCHTGNPSIFFEMPDVPVFCNVLSTNRNAALNMLKGTISLALCDNCGLISNAAFDPKLVEYNTMYENSLHFSSRFQRYIEATAWSLMEQHKLQNKGIIEIGCGQGDFLELFSKYGAGNCTGFDPSYDPTGSPLSSTITIFPELYTELNISLEADLVCCRHVLEHIDEPFDFMTNVRKTIGSQYDTVVFFEVPNALWLLRHSIWDFIYEHCLYFTPHALADLFQRTGFDPFEVREQYDSQFLTIQARPRMAGMPVSPFSVKIEAEPEQLCHNLGITYRSRIDYWRRTLDTLKKRNSRTVIWGAGSKGVTFTNTLGITHDQIPYVVDINPRKHWKYVAGTGQQIVPPRFLREYKPNTVIIMNPIYGNEIRQLLYDLGIAAELMTL